MKQIVALFAIAWLSLGLLRAVADDESVEVFYNQLAPYGDWMDAGDYGYVWHPRDASADWRPYADGHWAYTDAGWTWLSDEPYSWAVYHYGRWTRIVDVGWVWVPGTEWGPAWVSFRHGHHHIGWAPLPPEAEFGGPVRDIGAWSDSYYDIGPTDYVFVDARNFGAPRLHDVELPLRENVTFIDDTTNITNIRVENNAVFNGGPEFDAINRESAQKIPRLRLERRTNGFGSDPNSFRASVQGNALSVAAPVIAAAAANVAPSKVARKLQNVQVNHGWKDAGNAAAVQKLRSKLKSQAKIPAGLPAQPKFQRTAAAAAAAPGEKSAATEKSLPKTEATPAGKGKKGKRNETTPAIAPAAKPAESGKTKAERPEAATESKKPKKREESESAPRGSKSEKAKPEERAPKPEAHGKPEPHHEAAPAAGDKGKKKDEKKDEKKPE